MKGLRLTIARQTVSSILDTLGDDDFFNIIAVSLGSALCFVHKCNVTDRAFKMLCSRSTTRRSTMWSRVWMARWSELTEPIKMWVTVKLAGDKYVPIQSGWICVVTCFFFSFLLAFPGTSGQAVCQRDRAAGWSAGRSLHHPEWCKFQHSEALSLYCVHHCHFNEDAVQTFIFSYITKPTDSVVFFYRLLIMRPSCWVFTKISQSDSCIYWFVWHKYNEFLHSLHDCTLFSFHWQTPLDQNIRKTFILQPAFVLADRKCSSPTLCMFLTNSKKSHTPVRYISACGRCVACRNAPVLSLFHPPNTDTSILKRD